MEGYPLQQLVTLLGSDAGRFDDALLATHVRGISTDTRTLRSGEVFFALRGERFDGIHFVDAAFEKGAVAAVVNRGSETGAMLSKPVIPVKDSIRALGIVAKDYRNAFPGNVVAITGSSGKTTVKEMTMQVLKTRWSVHGSSGSFNNHIGLPLSLFGLERRHECGVFELGMSAPGEIAYLADIAQPHIGVILNVGPAHLAFFSGIEEVAQSKMELLEVLGGEGTAIVNGDDPLLSSAERYRVGRIVRFGIEGNHDFRAQNITLHEDGCASFDIEGCTLRLAVPGRHSVYNALAAYAVGRLLDVDQAGAVEALEHFSAPDMRMRSLETKGVRLIDDTYNANPHSMRAAANVLSMMRAERKIAVLGDMLELGNISDKEHEAVGKLFGTIGLERLVCIGDSAERYRAGAIEGGMKPASITVFPDTAAAVPFVQEIARPGDVLFVKGSRALGMEKIIEALSGAD